MAETKKFVNPVECFNTGWVTGDTYSKQAIRQDNGGTVEYFSRDEFDITVSVTRKPRFFRKGNYVEATTAEDVSYYLRNGYTQVLIESKAV